jgi:Na+-driven multidrug efflux pump
MLARLIGDIGVSTFSVLSFIYSLANAILSGVAQGLQTLWGRCYGKQDTEEIGWYFRCGIIINSILSVFIYGLLFVFNTPVIWIFNRDVELMQTASAALPLFALSFIPMAINLIYTAFLFSTKRTGTADMIAISRGIVVKALAIFSIPMLFGVNAIWIAPFIAEIITLILAIWLSKTTKLVYQ